MPIYHLNAKIIGRSGGRSATASAAYRAGEKIKDERQGLVFNYKSRIQAVAYSEIICPDKTPESLKNRSSLWNSVELSEKRKDSQVAREVEVALPKELTKEQNIALAREFSIASFVDRGMIADVCIHDIDGNNPHAHILLTTREVNENGFGQKNREWNKPENLNDWRKEWEKACNRHLEIAGLDVRVDHRTLKEQGLDREPQKHKGVAVTGLERRTGNPSIIGTKFEMNSIAKNARERIQKQLEEKRLVELDRKAQIDKDKERSRGFSR